MDKNNENFLSNNNKWLKEIEELKVILKECGLTEEIKWNKPTFTFEGSNIVVIQGFKNYCALLFLKGVLMKDPNKILIKTGENTRVGRQIRFHEVKEILDLKSVLKTYIIEAINVEKSGQKIPAEDNKEIILPYELQIRLEEMPALRTAWDALTPGRQRSYLFHFAGTNNPATREARIEKCIDRILEGIGYNEQYS